MTTKLSDDVRQALEQEGNSPVHLIDAATNAHYVIMRAEEYERIKTVLDEDLLTARQLYPLVRNSFLKAGWDDPEMDIYNDYDAHRPKP